MSDDGLSDCFDEPNMEIQIDTLTGTSFDMRVCSTDTIREIKQRIQRVEGIPIHQQNLIFQSKELKDSRRLCDVGIKNGSIIKLVLSMRGGPISTRRVSVSCEHHSMLKELKELLDNTRDEVGDCLTPGSKVSVLVFKEGDILNLLRVIENEDGSYSPYNNNNSEKPISPPTKKKINHEKVETIPNNLTNSNILIHNEHAIFEKLAEDTDMMTKISNLRKKMDDLNIRRQLRHKTTNNNNNKPNLSYKLINDSDLLYNLKIYEKAKMDESSKIQEEETQSEEEIALKDKHRIKRNRSIFSENKGAFSHIKRNYTKINNNTKDLRNLHLTRFVVSSTSSASTSASSEAATSSANDNLEYNDNLWDLHDSTVGLLKSHHNNNNNDLGGAATADLGQNNFEVCSNFFLPQLSIKNDYYFNNHSPLYGRNDNGKLPELKNEFSIERLKNDDFPSTNSKKTKENLDDVYGYYNLGCTTELLTSNDVRKTIELPPVMVKKKSRCNECNKKLNITNIYNCRCGKIFCSQHRYSEVHQCNYDYKNEGKRILEHQNPLITAEKIHRI